MRLHLPLDKIRSCRGFNPQLAARLTNPAKASAYGIFVQPRVATLEVFC